MKSFPQGNIGVILKDVIHSDKLHLPVLPLHGDPLIHCIVFCPWRRRGSCQAVQLNWSQASNCLPGKSRTGQPVAPAASQTAGGISFLNFLFCPSVASLIQSPE